MPRKIARVFDRDTQMWIDNDEWLHLHWQEMSDQDIADYILLRVHGRISEPPASYRWDASTHHIIAA